MQQHTGYRKLINNGSSIFPMRLHRLSQMLGKSQCMHKASTHASDTELIHADAYALVAEECWQLVQEDPDLLHLFLHSYDREYCDLSPEALARIRSRLRESTEDVRCVCLQSAFYVRRFREGAFIRERDPVLFVCACEEEEERSSLYHATDEPALWISLSLLRPMEYTRYAMGGAPVIGKQKRAQPLVPQERRSALESFREWFHLVSSMDTA